MSDTIPDALPELTLRERLGGRWAISWQAFLLTLPLAPVVLVASDAESLEEVGGWLVASAIGILFLAGLTYLLHRTVFRHRATDPVAVPIVIGSEVFTMLVLITIVTVAAVLLGLPFERSPMTRIVQTVIVGVWWSTGLVLMLDSRWRLSLERDAVIDRAVRQRLAAMQEADVISTIRRRLREDVSDELAPARRAVEQRLADMSERAPSAADAADLLRDTAESAVRPLSHRLAEIATERLPRPRLRDMFRNIITRQPFRPLAVSVVYVVTATPRDVERYGWGEGSVRIALTVGLIFATMSIANWAMRRWPRHHAGLFIAGIVLIETPSIVIPLLVASIQGTPFPWDETILSVVVGIMLIFVTSGFGSWRLARRDLIRTFELDVRLEEIETLANGRALAAVAKDAAGLLHGTVQTKLVACAMAIDHAAAGGDVVAVNQALTQARAILEDPLPIDRVDKDSSIADAVSRKAELWRGLTAVSVQVDPTIAELSGIVSNNVAAVVEEAIANAVQHGSATGVDIRIVSEGRHVLIEVDDDGHGPAMGRPGLGSQLLNAVADEWHLDATSTGARVVVRLPKHATERTAR